MQTDQLASDRPASKGGRDKVCSVGDRTQDESAPSLGGRKGRRVRRRAVINSGDKGIDQARAGWMVWRSVLDPRKVAEVTVTAGLGLVKCGESLGTGVSTGMGTGADGASGPGWWLGRAPGLLGHKGHSPDG